jgi:membrane-bound inhibitor of C-type lysozyme
MRFLKNKLSASASATLIALSLTACASTPPTVSQPLRLVKYACDTGEFVEVRYSSSEGVATLVRAGSAIVLRQQSTASGFVYSNGPNTIRGQGDELRVEIGRMAAISCRAQ